MRLVRAAVKLLKNMMDTVKTVEFEKLQRGLYVLTETTLTAWPLQSAMDCGV